MARASVERAGRPSEDAREELIRQFQAIQTRWEGMEWREIVAASDTESGTS